MGHKEKYETPDPISQVFLILFLSHDDYYCARNRRKEREKEKKSGFYKFIYGQEGLKKNWGEGKVTCVALLFPDFLFLFLGTTEAIKNRRNLNTSCCFCFYLLFFSQNLQRTLVFDTIMCFCSCTINYSYSSCSKYSELNVRMWNFFLFFEEEEEEQEEEEEEEEKEEEQEEKEEEDGF